MKNIDNEMIKNKVNNFVFYQNFVRYILRDSLNDLNLTSDELEYAINYINKSDIKIVDYELTKKDRTTSVDEYNYGDVIGYGINHLDMPVLADLEYNDDGDLIYSDYSKLDEYIENNILPYYIIKNSKDNCYYVRLRDLLTFQFSEIELKYIIEYLNHKHIFVLGYSTVFEGEFENYVSTFNYKNAYVKRYVTAEQNLDKLTQYKENPSLELRNEIFLLNLGLVKKNAHEFSKKINISIYDVEAYGYEGLIDAIETFDVSRGYKFSTYADDCIRNKMIQEISRVLGFGKGNFYRKYFIIKNDVESNVDKKIEDDISLVDDILEKLIEKGIICKDFINLHRDKIMFNIAQNEDLDKYIEFLDDYYDICNLNDDCNSDCFIQDNLLELEIMNNELLLLFKEYFECLGENELKVINMHYGFSNNPIMNLSEIGRILGLSRERVRQIHNSALKKLKKLARRDGLGTYIKEYDKYNYNPNVIVAYQNKKKR